MSTRKRSGSGSKKQLKEKIVQIYESFFKGEDLIKLNPNFWDELFLLKPKVSHLEREILRLNDEQLTTATENINALCIQCIETLGHQHQLRVVYSLQTLCALISAVYKQSSTQGDVINLLTGFDAAETSMKTLLDHINNILTGLSPHIPQGYDAMFPRALGAIFGECFPFQNHLAEKVSQRTDAVNKAYLHKYFFHHQVYYLSTGSKPGDRRSENVPNLKSLCLKLLLLIVTGNDNVSQNTLLEYLMVNSIFETLIQLLCETKSRSCHGHDLVILLTLLVNYRKHELRNPYIVKLSILDDQLALNGYGQVITSSLSDFCRQFKSEQPDPQASGWFSSISTMVGSMFVSEDGQTKNQQIRANNGVLVALYEAVHLNRNFVSALAHAQTEITPPPVDDQTVPEPSNLLGTFFQYCSIVMQDTKCEGSVNTVKLCFLVLTCVAEDQYANSIMHDPALVFKVQLHRLPMRHRVISNETPAQPLANTLLDLLVEFIMSHMMKRLPLELYLRCLGVVHRLLCYQKRCRVRLSYPWKNLWAALISLLKFILTTESHLAKKINVFLLAQQVVNIFNLFITYGDTFLHSPASYDELYYEIIRMHKVFDNVYAMAFRFSAVEGEFKDSALKLANSLVNVRSLINHYTPKIDAWLAGQALSTPSEDQILEVVRKNYDSLTLKLQDSLDQYERYSESPKHSAFFTALVRNVVTDVRQSIDFASLDFHSLLQEFSTIS